MTRSITKDDIEAIDASAKHLLESGHHTIHIGLHQQWPGLRDMALASIARSETSVRDAVIEECAALVEAQPDCGMVPSEIASAIRAMKINAGSLLARQCVGADVATSGPAPSCSDKEQATIPAQYLYRWTADGMELGRDVQTGWVPAAVLSPGNWTRIDSRVTNEQSDAEVMERVNNLCERTDPRLLVSVLKGELWAAWSGLSSSTSYTYGPSGLEAQLDKERRDHIQAMKDLAAENERLRSASSLTEAQQACIDIFRDWSEAEVRQETPAVQSAWDVGRALAADRGKTNV